MDQSRDDRIRNRAYELWERDGGRHGDDWSYWLQAEREITLEDTPASPEEKATAKAKAAAEPFPEAPLPKTSGRKPAAPKGPAAKAPATKPATAKPAGAKKADDKKAEDKKLAATKPAPKPRKPAAAKSRTASGSPPASKG